MKTSMFKTLVASFALVALPVALPAAVHAQDLKIGYVNSERVLREAAPAKAAKRAKVVRAARRTAAAAPKRRGAALRLVKAGAASNGTRIKRPA